MTSLYLQAPRMRAPFCRALQIHSKTVPCPVERTNQTDNRWKKGIITILHFTDGEVKHIDWWVIYPSSQTVRAGNRVQISRVSAQDSSSSPVLRENRVFVWKPHHLLPFCLFFEVCNSLIWLFIACQLPEILFYKVVWIRYVVGSFEKSKWCHTI